MSFKKKVLFIPSSEGTEVIHLFSPPEVYNPTKFTITFLVEPNIDVGRSVMAALSTLKIQGAIPNILVREIGVLIADIPKNLEKKDSLLYLLEKHFEDHQDISLPIKVHELSIEPKKEIILISKNHKLGLEPKEEKLFIPTILKKDKAIFARMVFQNEKKFTVNKNGFPNKFFRSGGQFRRL